MRGKKNLRFFRRRFSEIFCRSNKMRIVQIFNFPLTLKTQVPLNWKNVHFTQNGVTRILPTTIENGVRILYCDVVPNDGDVILHKY